MSASSRPSPNPFSPTTYPASEGHFFGSKIAYRVPTTGPHKQATHLFPRISLTRFITPTLAACVQKLSWTDENVAPDRWQKSAVNIMWVESSEWTKFGGKAPRCFLESGGTWGRPLDLINIHWSLVRTTFWGGFLEYGWLTYRPRGVYQST